MFLLLRSLLIAECWLTASGDGEVVELLYISGGRDDIIIGCCLLSPKDDAVDIIRLRRRFHSLFSTLLSILALNA